MAHLALNPSYVFFVLFFCSFPFLGILRKKTCFPLKRGIFCLVFSVSLCFSQAFCFIIPFSLSLSLSLSLFLCVCVCVSLSFSLSLSLVVLFFPYLLVFCFLLLPFFVVVFIFLISLLCFMKRTTSKHQILKFVFHQ